MGFLVRKHNGIYSFTGVARLGIITFIISIAYSFVDTIWAVYLNNIFHSPSIISFVSALLAIIAFASFFILVPVIERNNKSKLFSLSLTFIAISYLMFALSKNLVLFFLSSLILTIFTSLRINSFGIIIRDKSSKKKLSRNEGLIYTFFNVAWLVGPVIAGFILQAYGIPTIFFLSVFFILLGLGLFLISNINNANIKKTPEKNLLKNFLSFFKNRDRVYSYILSGGVNFWLILIYLYVPLMILERNIHEFWIGIFLSAIVIPLVLFEFAFSKLAGKVGFKKIFRAGYFILAIASFSCFFINNIFIILGVLVLASIGVAMIEPTTEAYFFDILRKKEDELKFYGIYNTSIDVHQFIGKFILGFLLLFFPLKSTFIFFSIFMFLYFLLCSKIRNVNEERRRK
ncbi:MAG: MFS transporter [Candidatus Pacearchaeota archaeon]